MSDVSGDAIGNRKLRITWKSFLLHDVTEVSASPRPTGHLRLIQTTDLHMHLMAFDYLLDRPNAQQGLVALAPLIATARQQVAASVLCDTGDFLQGTPLADDIAGRRMLPHPMVQAFNTLRYDAVTLGNHDFDYGLPYLRAVLADLHAPVVSANLKADGNAPFAAPWTLVTRQVACSDGQTRDLRVGIIGFGPPQIADWGAAWLHGMVTTDDIIATARQEVPLLRAAGADVIVALCHGGPAAGADSAENAALQLAALPQIDVVLMGHMHEVFPGTAFGPMPQVDPHRGTLAGKPAMMAGAHGKEVGILDLTLSVAAPDADGSQPARPMWRVVDHRCKVIRPSEPAVAPSILSRLLHNRLALPHAATLDRLRQPIGQTPVALTSHFAAIGADMTAPLLAQVQIEAISAALAGTPHAGLPVLATTAPFRAGGHGGPDNYIAISPGPLRRRDCAAIVPFDNPICAVLRRGWQIRAWLECCSAFFATLTPGRTDQALLNPRMAPYHFDTLHGLQYRIDLTVPPALPGAPPSRHRRITELTLRGRALDDDALCVVATSSYRAHGGGGIIAVPPQDIVHTSRDGLRTMLMQALHRSQGAVASAPQPWTFAPLPGTTARFTSSPQARDTLADHPHVTFAGLQDDGFASYRIAFCDVSGLHAPITAAI
ncbi:5'-nucleotidase C-terminal domain-containing protein [Loktanella sp. M215]|uniref:5'-nucleotidase C-terminal domain-containing protein n=1 Tax=Loktanella sp. M215 TaxID=2675431 RepID=UPI001F022498|nr:5'-nucleotidase C-terminal domain-containing protein [Loktanella sp. M215]